MVNASQTKYNLSSPESYEGLFTSVNGYVGGSLGMGLILVIWIITFFTLQTYPNIDALKASTWVAWLMSLFMTLVGLIQPAFSILLFIVVLATTAYSAKPRR